MTINIELYDDLIPKAKIEKPPLILYSTPQEQSWYFYMAMKSAGLIRIKPEYLRWAMKRGDLWMARYFLLEKILLDSGLDYKHVRDMPKDEIYDVIHSSDRSPTKKTGEQHG